MAHTQGPAPLTTAPPWRAAVVRVLGPKEIAVRIGSDAYDMCMCLSVVGSEYR